ncbi:MAG: protein translocase subunit SecD, partial [Rubrobacteraceae bacterium]
LGFYQVLATDQQDNVPQNEVKEVRKDIEENLKDDSEFEKGKTKVLFEESPPIQGPGVFVSGYVVNEEPAITGSELRQNGANVDFGQTGKREVTLQFTDEGGGKFADLTQKMVNDGLASGAPSQLAIAIDDDIQSAPTVEQPILNGDVSTNNDGLPEGLPEEEATQLATVLNTGALPVDMEVISVQTIGPTLGADSLNAGLLAALIGFGLVLVFLAVIYRALGLLADLALLVYAFLLWGIIVAVPITVTLPGIAGIVLSIGVAADANIVIFERIKEEVRRGKTARSAIQAGFEKGFRAILDGNITTVIVAFILFALSSGSVRGFAVLLALGVALSMFTAVVVTRALLGLISGRGVQLSPGMMGVSKKSIAAVQRTVK